jgi:predicted TIM-barrel fold metal-dependent hydrolase
VKIDTHLHVMTESFFGRPPTDFGKLLDDLQGVGLDGGWISAVDGLITRDLQVQIRTHDRMAAGMANHPGCFRGFCTVEPGAMDAAGKEIERCRRELDFIGIKIHSWLQGFSLTHKGMRIIMETAEALSMPVLFHDGTPPYASSLQVLWLARQFPRTQVILGHCGLLDQWPDAVAGAQQTANVWLQPTCAPPIAIRAALDAVGDDRILFGSDGGYGSPRFIRYCLKKNEYALGEQALLKAMSENPVRLLQRKRQTDRRPPEMAAGDGVKDQGKTMGIFYGERRKA